MTKIVALMLSLALLSACSDLAEDPSVPPRDWESSNYVQENDDTEMSYLYCAVYDLSGLEI